MGPRAPRPRRDRSLAASYTSDVLPNMVNPDLIGVDVRANGIRRYSRVRRPVQVAGRPLGKVRVHPGAEKWGQQERQ